MRDGMRRTPRWARATVNRVNGIQVLGLKRALAEEAENLAAARGKKQVRRSLLAVHQICDRLIEATAGERAPLPENAVPYEPTREYVRQEIEALPAIVANRGEAERVRALMRARLVAARALQMVIGLVLAAGCPLCDHAHLDNLIDGIGIDPEIGMLVAGLLTGTGWIS